MADRVLVDAPCTGTGVIGRRPDIKWRRKPKHLERIVELQKSILIHVQRFVKPNGILVYATCSLEEEENWQVVEAFLKLHNDFRVASIENPQLVNLIDEKRALKTSCFRLLISREGSEERPNARLFFHYHQI